jgi:hypothetical protein
MSDDDHRASRLRGHGVRGGAREGALHRRHTPALHDQRSCRLRLVQQCVNSGTRHGHEADSSAGINHRGQRTPGLFDDLPAACQMALQCLAPGSNRQPREASVNQGDRRVSLATHLRSEAQRGTVVVRTAVTDANNEAVACLAIA